MSVPEEEAQEVGVEGVCVCLLLVRARAKMKGNKYGATWSAGDYRRKVQLARLCAWELNSILYTQEIGNQFSSHRERGSR